MKKTLGMARHASRCKERNGGVIRPQQRKVRKTGKANQTDGKKKKKKTKRKKQKKSERERERREESERKKKKKWADI